MKFVKVFHSSEDDFVIGIPDVLDTDLFLDAVLHGAAGWGEAKDTIEEALGAEWDEAEDATTSGSENGVIYTHDEAARLVEMFEDVLSRYNISIPSPEDDDRSPDDMIGLYGSTYSDLLDGIESELLELLEKHRPGVQIVDGEFSGNF